MIKKKLALLIVSLCAVLLVGCGKVIDLTEEETQLIAEYAAELLLKYDRNYVDRIDVGNEKNEEMSSEALESTVEENATEHTSSEEITESASTEKQVEEDFKDENTGEELSDDESQDLPDGKTVGTESDIAVIAGIDGGKITFRDYSIVDMYPATDEQGEFIYLEASEGYQLLVLKFDVVNTTSDMLSVSLMDKDLDYRIVCNGTKAANPMLTILMDDLGTLETNVEPDVPQEAVLIFQISDGMQDDLDTMDLYVTYSETENVIHILQ